MKADPRALNVAKSHLAIQNAAPYHGRLRPGEDLNMAQMKNFSSLVNNANTGATGNMISYTMPADGRITSIMVGLNGTVTAREISLLLTTGGVTYTLHTFIGVTGQPSYTLTTEMRLLANDIVVLNVDVADGATTGDAAFFGEHLDVG